MPIIGILGVELTAESIASEALPIHCRSFSFGAPLQASSASWRVTVIVPIGQCIDSGADSGHYTEHKQMPSKWQRPDRTSRQCRVFQYQIRKRQQY